MVEILTQRYKPLQDELSRIERDLHAQGYHAFSTEVANFRYAVEKGFHKAVDNLIED